MPCRRPLIRLFLIRSHSNKGCFGRIDWPIFWMLKCLAVAVESLNSSKNWISRTNTFIRLRSCLLFQKNQLLLLVTSQNWRFVFLLNTFKGVCNYCVVRWIIVLIHKSLNLLCSSVFLTGTSLVLTRGLLLVCSWLLFWGVVKVCELLTAALMARLFFPIWMLFSYVFALRRISIKLSYCSNWLYLYELLLLLGLLICEICDFRLLLSVNF